MIESFEKALPENRIKKITGEDIPKFKENIKPKIVNAFEIADKPLSIAADITPVVGDVKGIQEALTGKDIITGETLTKLERIIGGGISVVSVVAEMSVLGAPAALILKGPVKAGLKGLIKEGSEEVFKEIPKFSKNIEFSKINSFEKADKALYEKIVCRNENLEGGIHRETGIQFDKKTIKFPDGGIKEGVFPKFKSDFDVKLDENLWKASDKVQFEECNLKLQEYMIKNPESLKKFTIEQIEQIKNGDIPDGYTWHHDAELGKMQLVDSEIHSKTGHTGGKVVWGGGSENR